MLGTVKVPGKLCKVAVVTVGWRSRRVVNRSFSAATAMAVRICCSSPRSSTAFMRANSWRSLLLSSSSVLICRRFFSEGRRICSTAAEKGCLPVADQMPKSQKR